MIPPKSILDLVHPPDLRAQVVQIIKSDCIELQACKPVNLTLASGKYTYIDLANCVFEKLSATNVSTFRSTVVRCKVSSSQLTGLQLPEGNFKNVVFENCKLNVTNFRSSEFVNCMFKECDLTEGDFGGSSLKNVLFSNCQLEGVDFSNCKNKRLEFEESSLAGIKGITGLRNSTVSSENLIELSQLLAAEMGIQAREIYA